jgi:hypothetical protein
MANTGYKVKPLKDWKHDDSQKPYLRWNWFILPNVYVSIEGSKENGFGVNMHGIPDYKDFRWVSAKKELGGSATAHKFRTPGDAYKAFVSAYKKAGKAVKPSLQVVSARLNEAGIKHVIVIAGNQEVDRFLDLAVRNDYTTWGKQLPEAIKKLSVPVGLTKLRETAVKVIMSNIERIIKEHEFEGLVTRKDIVDFVLDNDYEILEMLKRQHSKK